MTALPRLYAIADAQFGDPVEIAQALRTAYGLEIEPKYVAVCLERLAGMGLEPTLSKATRK